MRLIDKGDYSLKHVVVVTNGRHPAECLAMALNNEKPPGNHFTHLGYCVLKIKSRYLTQNAAI